VGTGGTVSTGAVDPLPDIAALCRARNIWFHVDGAYGGFAVAAPEAPDDLRALSDADSVAVDPHKWLYAPLEAGCALVRDPEKLRAAFGRFGGEGRSFPSSLPLSTSAQGRTRPRPVPKCSCDCGSRQRRSGTSELRIPRGGI